MNFCPNCGSELPFGSAFCPKCGAVLNENNNGGYPVGTVPAETGLQTAAKILMIIATVISGFAIIPLAWCVPMTVSYCNKLKRGEPVGVGFKVCTLLFVSLISGILMLCDSN